MSTKQAMLWFSAISILLVIAGIVLAFFDLKILPVDNATLLPWQSAIYGAIMVGWGTTLFGVGRLAFL